MARLFDPGFLPESLCDASIRTLPSLPFFSLLLSFSRPLFPVVFTQGAEHVSLDTWTPTRQQEKVLLLRCAALPRLEQDEERLPRPSQGWRLVRRVPLPRSRRQLVKPAKEIYEPYVIGQPTAECQFRGEVTSGREGHDVDLVIVAQSDVEKDTMSAMLMLATVLDELDIGQHPAECQLMVLPSRRKLVTQRCKLRPAQGGSSPCPRRAEQKTPMSVSCRGSLRCARKE